jgi:hypothetical protein
VAVGAVAERLQRRAGAHTKVNIAIALCVVALASYQIGRAIDAARTMNFSSAFVAAVARHDGLRNWHGPVTVIAADAAVRQLLNDTVGGYLTVVLRTTLSRTDLQGIVIDQGDVDGSGGHSLRLQCLYRDNQVVLREPAID